MTGAAGTRTLVAACIHFWTSTAAWVVLGALALFIGPALHLRPAQLTLLVSLPALGGALFRIPVGYLADRWGEKRTGTAAIALTLVPLLVAAALGRIPAVVYGCALLLGVAGASFAVAVPIAGRWFPRARQGTVLGIVGTGNCGAVLAVASAPWLAARVGWQGALGVAAVAIALALVAWVALAADPPRRIAPATRGQFTRTATAADTWWFCLFYGITFGGFLALSSAFGIVLHGQYDVDTGHVAAIIAGAALLASIARPIGGAIADRAGAPAVLRLVFGTFAACSLGIAATPSLALAVTLIAAVAIALGVGNGATFQLVPQRFTADFGAATGIVGAAGGLGGFLLANVLGATRAATGGYAAGFVVFAAVGVVGLVAVTAKSSAWRRSFLAAEPALEAAG